MKRLHLICNAHLDPVWQWEWEEGAAAAVSTFRVAARFCEEYEGFVFNHNEVILYKWIEEYEPELFKKIQRLVKEGRWHIMGGWYLQPDCNMPSGESFIRQILMGRSYFSRKFGVCPITAINFDSFGHTRGLVQILKKSGYDSYIFQRPLGDELSLPADDFLWVGPDGSEIMVHRISMGYNTLLGKACEKVSGYMEENAEKPIGLVAWGVGNHGGGPSRTDLETINELITGTESVEIVHSTPESYFKDMKESGIALPRFEKDLSPNSVGCYTSQIRIKQRHRLLENELFMVEKMLSSAAIQGYMMYPQDELNDAMNDLLTSEFHDILPGSSVQPVEETSLRLLDHGLEIASRLKARAFFALASGQDAAKDGEIPILIYNPHPFKVEGMFECEFMLADQNWKDEFTLPVVYRDGLKLPSQPEKENSNISLDWRKRVVFAATLAPSHMNRFDVKFETLPEKPKPSLSTENGKVIFQTPDLRVVINCDTGLVDEYMVSGINYMKEGAFRSIAADDYDDSWALTKYSFQDICGSFKLMSPEEGTTFSGIKGKAIPSVRVIEDGEVRAVVEALFKYNNSYICQRYKLPKRGTEIEVEVRVDWSEKSKFLKLSIPTILENAEYFGQTAFGIRVLCTDGSETVSQKWCIAESKKAGIAFSCINNGIYGSDFKDGEIRLSLLRSPGYTCIDTSWLHLDKPMMPEDRYSPRMDQGERQYNFWFNAGTIKDRRNSIDREASVHNEKPYTLSFFPSGEGSKPGIPVVLEDDIVQMPAFKKAADSDDFIIRLFEPVGEDRSTTVLIPIFKLRQTVWLRKFEVKTFKIDVHNKLLVETNLTE